MNEFTLTDIWQIRNKKELFLLKGKGRDGIVQSRIDYCLITCAMEYLMNNCSIKPGYLSDYSIISLTIDLIGTQTTGKGSWKFNKDLLDD